MKQFATSDYVAIGLLLYAAFCTAGFTVVLAKALIEAVS